MIIAYVQASVMTAGAKVASVAMAVMSAVRYSINQSIHSMLFLLTRFFVVARAEKVGKMIKWHENKGRYTCSVC